MICINEAQEFSRNIFISAQYDNNQINRITIGREKAMLEYFVSQFLPRE